MKRWQVGIVDYGASNQNSVMRTIQGIGHKCFVSHLPEQLASADLLLLPGVGAFPPAMAALHRYGLVETIACHASAGRPLLGICLGMQLLTELSTEVEETAGLNLIPGRITQLTAARRHIGWNTVVASNEDPLFAPSIGHSFYFNHSFAYYGPRECTVCVTDDEPPVTAVVRRGNVIGLQFHPEKSQAAGRHLLGHLIDQLCGTPG